MTELSKTEELVVKELMKGLTNAEIGKNLGINYKTVKYHLVNVFRKFGVTSRLKLMAKIHKQKLEAQTYSEEEELHTIINY